MLRAEGVAKRYGATVALEGLDLAIAPGEFFALLGGSGSGKTTLLRLVAGFETPDAGRLLLEGRDLVPLPPYRRPVAMMFQNYALFPHLDVFDNVAYGLRRAGVPSAELRRRVAEALALVRLAGLERRRPHRLSGGQRQRVALARSLVVRPRLLLLDEPLAALDAGLREATGFELRALQRATGAAFVMVTHDQAEAMALADRIGVLERGRLVQVGPPREVYERPATRFVATFLGGANLLAGTVRADGGVDCAEAGCVLRPAAPLARPAGSAVTLALRPERVRMRPEAADRAAAAEGEGPNATRGTVVEIAYRGELSTCLVRLDGGTALRVSRPSAEGVPARGTRVALAWPGEALTVLAD
ncbi:ABC transporter ATP-binding protein [Caldovatus aquaticus]|uniref:ABC transporter ATP-binding protein n=1 Tax=Caldovatus aquaticus TaxID=2865671 RepID=UPI002101F57B|nr:ABC transporter ATP-binding protein [Caldovatus aquaticus]